MKSKRPQKILQGFGSLSISLHAFMLRPVNNFVFQFHSPIVEVNRCNRLRKQEINEKCARSTEDCDVLFRKFYPYHILFFWVSLCWWFHSCYSNRSM